MSYLLALICLAAGMACLLWYKALPKTYADFMAKRFKELYGGFAITMKWDNPNTWQSMGYKLGTIGAGFFFIALAVYLTFGTIHIGS
jgi:hypothetical protein